MADTRKTKISFWRALRACLYAIFAPSKLIEEERRDNKVKDGFSEPPPEAPHRAYTIQRAFWSSLGLVVVSTLAGFVLGKLDSHLIGQTSQKTITVLQVIGAMLLLWGTLFVRGWEIQTFSGVVLGERVNQWIYRGLYCLGTAIIVYSIVVTPANG